MVGRFLIVVLALAFGAAMPVGALAQDGRDQAVVRNEDLAITTEDDGDDDGKGLGTDTDSDSNSNTFTSGVDSNDGTNSRVTPVTRDRDRSRDDLTKDRTDDGPGPKKRDMSRHKTNDRTRNDTR